MKSISKILMVITVPISGLDGFAKIKSVDEVTQNVSQFITILPSKMR